MSDFPSVPPLTPAALTPNERMMEAAQRAVPMLAPATGAKLQGMIEGLTSPGSLAVLGIWAAAQLTPVGWVADGIMLGLAAFGLGKDAAQGFGDLASFVTGSRAAQSEADLNAAARSLASGVTTLGIDTVQTILLRKAAAESEAQPLVKQEAAIKETLPNAPASQEYCARCEAAAAQVDRNTWFTEVGLANSKGGDLGTLDAVDMTNKKFIENKSAKGIDSVNPRTGLPALTPAEWAKKHIYNKTEVRLENLKTMAYTRPTEGASAAVPSMQEIQGIRNLEFHIQSTDASIKQATENELNQLRINHPDWSFSAIYGP